MGLFKHNCTTDGHKFKPRYSERWPDRGIKAEWVLNASDLKEKVYECDVCVKCGMTTEGQDNG